MPELSELHQSFALEPAVSWMLCRPLIRAAMFEQEEGKKDVPEHLVPYLPHTDSMKATSSAMLPEACWQYLTQDLFEMFYSHSLYDIHCPETRYKTEIVRLDKDKDRLNQLKKGGDAARGMMASMAAAAAAAGGTEREIRQATAFTKEHEKDLERLTRHSGLLSAHMKRQKKHCGEVRKTFESKKASFLSDLKDEDVQKLTAETFLTYCVYPRCRLTPEDALYCAEFVMLLHNMEVPGFFTLKYVDSLINAVVGAAYSITEDEAGNLSVLLKSTWAWIKNWRDDKAMFDKEVAGKVRILFGGRRYLCGFLYVPVLLSYIYNSTLLIYRFLMCAARWQSGQRRGCSRGYILRRFQETLQQVARHPWADLPGMLGIQGVHPYARRPHSPLENRQRVPNAARPRRKDYGCSRTSQG